MAELLRVLVVEDSEDDAALLVRELRRSGFALVTARVETEAEMNRALDDAAWDLVIADYALPRFSAPAALAVLKRRGLDLPFIIVSGTIGEETAVAAMKAGADDYFMKGKLARLVPAIQRELREAEARRERGRAEAALARERAYTRLLVEGGNALIVGLDLDGRVTVFNPAAEALTGYRRDDVRGKNWFDLMLPRVVAPRARKEFEKLKATGVPDDFENPIVTARGDERIITWRNVVLRDQGRVAGVLAFGMDVTERRRAEQERRALEQVARRAEKLAALGTLAAGLAHELNNPIGIISSRIELMLLEAESAGLPEHLLEDLRVLHRQAQRVARIASGLLSFARQSSGERMPVDLNHVVEETLLLAERQMEKEGIRVQTRLEPGLPPLLGDANTLQQVLLNLITNAWDALEAGGELHIETSGAPGPPAAVRLVVADSGPGIDPDVLPRIFDPFFSTKPRGTGLGLSITDGIVREHGGTIDVESARGRGTRFVLTFPTVATTAAPRA
jgi:two-component system, cell cycle sensor histidine kinase and response regulator CckA